MANIETQTRQLFSSVFGRAPESTSENRILRDVVSRKGFGQEAVGALQFQEQQGAFKTQEGGMASTSPQTGQPSQPLPTPTRQTATPSIDRSNTVASNDPNAIFESILQKTRELDEVAKKQATEAQLQKLQSEFNSKVNKQLVDQLVQLRGDVITRDFSPGGDVEPGIRNPLDAGEASLEQRGQLLENTTRLSQSVSNNRAGAADFFDSIRDQQDSELKIAQAGIDNARSLLNDSLAIAADQRAEKLNDLNIQKLRSDLQGGVISKEKILELGAEFGAEGLSELQHSLGLPATFPFAQNVTGYGYQNGDSTFYGTKHKGMDAMLPENSPLQSSVPLTITKVFNDDGGGLTVYGVDAQGTTHKFLHLNQALVSEGDVIQPGELFALSGNTGELTTGAHLHYELTDKNGTNIDPREYSLPGQTSFVSRREQEARKQNVAAEDSLRQEYTKQSQTFLDVQRSYSRIQASAQSPSAAGDLALIFSFMKLLDPTSVVREGEQASAQNATGVPQQIRNMYNRVINGERLNEAQRDDFLSRSESLYGAQKKIQEPTDNYYRTLAEQRGLNPTNVVVPYQSFLNGAQSTPGINSYLDSLGL